MHGGEGSPGITSAVQEKLLAALRAGCTRRAAAAAAGMSKTTLYRWLEHDEGTLRDAIEKAEGEAEAGATAIVGKAAFTNWQAAAWWLERRRPDDYARREKVDLSIEVRKAIERLAENPEERDAALAEVDRILTTR